ncbi:uncharacterized protein LOC5510968 [Nematostella vectensis]|uniref:uncharacterized protein LOC5510968 n=1 Tax=Nematostella vectensis TaxID=45351 RepID=UPI0020778CB4|nr:uncharacterized protein LOC5510968 [Nematostella vectensis]
MVAPGKTSFITPGRCHGSRCVKGLCIAVAATVLINWMFLGQSGNAKPGIAQLNKRTINIGYDGDAQSGNLNLERTSLKGSNLRQSDDPSVGFGKDFSSLENTAKEISARSIVDKLLQVKKIYQKDKYIYLKFKIKDTDSQDANEEQKEEIAGGILKIENYRNNIGGGRAIRKYNHFDTKGLNENRETVSVKVDAKIDVKGYESAALEKKKMKVMDYERYKKVDAKIDVKDNEETLIEKVDAKGNGNENEQMKTEQGDAGIDDNDEGEKKTAKVDAKSNDNENKQMNRDQGDGNIDDEDDGKKKTAKVDANGDEYKIDEAIKNTASAKIDVTENEEMGVAKGDGIGDEDNNEEDEDEDRKKEEVERKILSRATCPNNSLSQEGLPPYGKCTPHRPTLEACKTAYQFYNLEIPSLTCNDPHKADICSVTVTREKKQIEARCNDHLCDQDTIRTRSMNPMNGEHDAIETFSTIKTLAAALPRILKQNALNKFHYVFIECNRTSEVIRQLLPVSPVLTIQKHENARPKNTLNVNVILIDSVARAHFYRSLPETINLFKNWSRSEDAPAQVFDFELFQAVEGHTAENTHALFTGKLFPITEDRDAVRSVEMGKLFRHFRRAGYQTMWQEDLCWKGYWGLLVDMAKGYDWNVLADALEKEGIDHTGITHSACEVLRMYNTNTPFNGPQEGQICYNGRFQHSYYLDYNLHSFRAIRQSRSAKPLLSYNIFNVGHDNMGTRIKTFDRDLREYVDLIGREKDTITILLADHGNTYTRYTSAIAEGRFEMFHPSLFVIVPSNVATILGKEAVAALRTNQRRLTTMIDIHHALRALAGPITNGVRPDGIFGQIPDRTCNDVELRTPNLCVCEGWDSPTTNDTLKLALVEFAIGQLNNKIQQQFVGANGESAVAVTRACAKLKALSFYNVRERNSNGSMLTTMEIAVPSGDFVSQKEDVFQVEVKSRLSLETDSLDMELVHYERVSMFGKYKSCADKGVNPKLCVCSKHKKALTSKRDLRAEVLNVWWPLGKVYYKQLKSIGCLFLAKRVHGKSDAIGYDIANVCKRRTYTVRVVYTEANNIKMSHKSPVTVVVPAGGVTFVFSARKHYYYMEGRVRLKASVIY